MSEINALVNTYFNAIEQTDPLPLSKVIPLLNLKKIIILIQKGSLSKAEELTHFIYALVPYAEISCSIVEVNEGNKSGMLDTPFNLDLSEASVNKKEIFLSDITFIINDKNEILLYRNQELPSCCLFSLE